MWYFAWILGTLLACCLSIITGLVVENFDDSEAKKQDKQ